MHKVSLYMWPLWRICVRCERVSMCLSALVCLYGNPVSLTSSFLSEIKVKWVIYHENMWLGLLSLPCPVWLCVCARTGPTHIRGVRLKSNMSMPLPMCGCVQEEACLLVAVYMWRPLVFAYAMINGLHWAVQPCMFLGLSFYAVFN